MTLSSIRTAVATSVSSEVSSIAAAGVNSALGPFWALPASFLTGAAAAGGIAVINSIGNLGGFLGPYTMGALKEKFGFGGGFTAIACSLVIGAILVVLFRPKKNQSS